MIRTASALVALETGLERAGVQALFSDWSARARRSAIESDLRFHGLRLPAWIAAPTLISDSEIYGAMYVLEGSRLGARALLARIARSELSAPRSLEFLRANDLNLWRSFRARLEHASLDLHQATLAARPTFVTFKSAYM